MLDQSVRSNSDACLQGADRLDRFEHLELIVKVTERCNINCTYCYVFNKGNEDYKKRPPFIEDHTIDGMVDFVEKGVTDLGLKAVSIVLHGGEPLMLGKRRFNRLCTKLIERIGSLVRLSIGLQTNAMLIDSEWVDIFAAHRIAVGVSLDGPKQVNDQYRIDKRGSGSYTATMRGIEVLREGFNNGKIIKPGLICVINPKSDAAEIYNHFVHELGFTNVSFNLPMETVDSAPEGFGDDCAKYLVTLFDAWVRDGRTDVNIRIFDQLIRYLVGEKFAQEVMPNFITKHLMVVVAADGELSEHDDFKVINFAQRGGTVFDTSLASFAKSELRRYIHAVSQALPDDCKDCTWRRYCRAGVTHGLTVSRYSHKGGFNNRSVLCTGFDALFGRAAQFLLSNGATVEALEDALGLNDRDQTLERNLVPAIPLTLAPAAL